MADETKALGTTRTEQEIFDEIAELCVSPGYIHAIAYLCFRDNTIKYNEELAVDDIAEMFSDSRLLRTEISTLIGLMLREPVSFELPAPTIIDNYIARSDALMHEIHLAMSNEWIRDLDLEKIKSGVSNPLANARSLREPIFYGGESAYSFQYRDFVAQKYGKDAKWLMENKGVSVSSLSDVAKALGSLQNEKLIATLGSLRTKPPDQWTMLPSFKFSSEELAERSGYAQEEIGKILDAFCLPSSNCNRSFTALHEFNVANALPILRDGSGEFILLQNYSFVEALYESPFFWMAEDGDYATTAFKNRGKFTEEFCCDGLSRVFGEKRVYQGVDLFESKGSKLGEIDVLVVFGDRAIVLQAKSKRLTLEARKGNDLQLKSDFKKAIQDACDQAILCSEALIDGSCELRDSDGQVLSFPTPLKQVYPVCIVADHYPALAFQARQFLKFELKEKIARPLATDVFTLDVMVEMLASPLRFLSYLSHRAEYGEKLLMSHELTLLAYHLKYNLWVDEKYDIMHLDDDFSSHLDVAMMVRREGFQGAATPDGILTRHRDTHIGKLLNEIEALADSGSIALGLMLTELNDETIEDINNGIDQICAKFSEDGKHHDITAGIGSSRTGITIHCNQLPQQRASEHLERHCKKRKYVQRADSWFGLALTPEASVRFVGMIESPWKFNEEMESITRGMSFTANKKRKIGRNEPCPCGSGKKYKKCHLGRDRGIVA